MKIVETFDINTSFWQDNMQLVVAGPIKDLYESDKSKNKSQSSLLMWCIALIWDPASKYYRLPEEGPDSKITLIFTDFYKDITYYKKNEKLILAIRDFYRKLQETPAKRALREIEEKLEERSKFINRTKYDLGMCNEKGSWVGNTASIIDRMMADSKKIYDLYEAALKAVEKEGINDDRVKGGGTQSLSDQGEI